MNKITSYQGFLCQIDNLKKAGLSKCSNYFPNPGLHEQWISDGTWFTIYQGICWIIHDKGFHYELLFFSDSLELVKQTLPRLRKELDKTVVVEVISRGELDFKTDVFNVLSRMARIGKPARFEPNINIVKACEGDIGDIYEIFHTYFNPISERTPDPIEIGKMISNGSINLYKIDDEIAGFIIYDLYKTNEHLRYWWVSPLHRNKGIGSSLVKSFFKAGEHTVRQYLWVFKDNDNAIKRYRHYGFEFDGMNDYIIII